MLQTLVSVIVFGGVVVCMGRFIVCNVCSKTS